MKRFEGKGILITGGASDIGKATADRFCAEGGRVLIADRNEPGLEASALEIGGKQNCEVLTCHMDVTRKADVDRMVAFALERMGGIDVLINNAGIGYLAPFLELSEENWDETIEVNLKGHFLVAQAVAREMVKAKSGVIVNMCSTNGLVAELNLAHYNASKGGILLLTKSMALELAPFGIRVNCVAPGYVMTPLVFDAIEQDSSGAWELENYIRSNIPLGRAAQPEEIAGVFAFLASDDASFMTGESVLIDGGQLAS